MTLAINGGTPIRSTPMPIRRSFGEAEKESLYECISYYERIGEDPGYQSRFEELYCSEFVKFMGEESGFADAVNSGSTALFIALRALELPVGSEVLVSPITDPGTLSAIILNGLIPKLMDSAEDSYNIGFTQFAERVNSSTSAVVVVHSIGEPAPVAKISELAKSFGIKVVEDCSQAHGALIEGRPVGIFSDVAAFSTMYRKTHSTGPTGGVVYTRDEALFHNMIAHSDRGKPKWKTNFNERDPDSFLFPALNFNSSELACAIGLSSIKRLEDVRNARLNFVKELQKSLFEQEGLRGYPVTESMSPFIYPIFLPKFVTRATKIEFAEAVRAEGIPLNTDYKYLVYDWKWARNYLSDSFDTPNAALARNSSFCLYLNENYGEQEVKDCALAIRKVKKYFHL